MARALLWVLVVAGLLLLSGCGGGGDRFAGSWRSADRASGGRDFVIAKADAGYRVAFVDGGIGSGWLPLTRSGDTLKATWLTPSQDGAATSGGWMTFTYDSGSLLVQDSTLGADPPQLTFVRVSDAITAPSPGD